MNYSRQIIIDALATAKANQGWQTIVQNSAAYGAGQMQSTGAQNDSITFDFLASPGTYALDLFHMTGTTRGIYSIYIDDVLQTSTIDGYDSGIFARRGQASGLTVVTDGQHTIMLKMATKNASSSSYFGVISRIVLTRTA